MPNRFLFAVALTALLTAPLAAQVQKQDMPGIRNYSRVDATVGCGGATDPSAMVGLRKEGFVAVVNLRLASEQGANVEAGRAAAQTAGLKYIHLPFDGTSADPAIVEGFLAAVGGPQQPAGVHPLRLREPGGRRLDDQADTAGQVDCREGARRGRGHRSQKRGAQDLRSRVHQGASVTFRILALGSRLRNLESKLWALR